MSTNLEIEAKSMLTKEEYYKLAGSFLDLEAYVQNNYYLDTKDLKIDEQKCGLRIREKGGEFEITLKVPEGDGKLEITQQISPIIFQNLNKAGVFPPGEIAQFLTTKLDIKLDDLAILGNLLTKRLDVEYKSSLVSIDMSHYNGITDYEVECENKTMKKALRHLKSFLKKYGVEYKKSPGGKLKRFLDTYKG